MIYQFRDQDADARTGQYIRKVMSVVQHSERSGDRSKPVTAVGQNGAGFPKFFV